MKKAFLPAFLLFAGFFWGKPDYSKASLILEEMKKAEMSGDCGQVWKNYESFLEQKPPLKMKKYAYIYCASCYEKNRAYEQAAAIYKLAIELYPQENIFLKKACSLYLANGLYLSALNMAVKIEKKDPHDQENWLFMARAYAGLGFWRKSVPYYRKIAAVDMKNYDIMLEYCRALKNSSQYREGYELAIKIAESSSDERFYITAAEISALSGDLSKAVSILYKMEEKDICSLKCRKMKAVYSFFLGRHDEVVKQLPFLEKDQAFYSFMLALEQSKNGDISGARKNFARAASLGGGFIKKAAEKYSMEN